MRKAILFLAVTVLAVLFLQACSKDQNPFSSSDTPAPTSTFTVTPTGTWFTPTSTPYPSTTSCPYSALPIFFGGNAITIYGDTSTASNIFDSQCNALAGAPDILYYLDAPGQNLSFEVVSAWDSTLCVRASVCAGYNCLTCGGSVTGAVSYTPAGPVYLIIDGLNPGQQGAYELRIRPFVATATPTATRTHTLQYTATPTATPTHTPVITSTFTPSATRTGTPTATRTPTPTYTRTNTPPPGTITSTPTVCSTKSFVGYATVGVNATYANYAWACAITIAQSSTAYAVSLYCPSATNARAAIYGDNAGSLTPLLVESASVPVVAGWNRIPLTATGLPGPAVYWLALQTESGAVNYAAVTGYRYAIRSSHAYGPFLSTSWSTSQGDAFPIRVELCP